MYLYTVLSYMAMVLQFNVLIYCVVLYGHCTWPLYNVLIYCVVFRRPWYFNSMYLYTVLLSSDGFCPDGMPPNTCFIDPCTFASCPLNPDAECVANYCARTAPCLAEWFDANGNQVECGKYQNRLEVILHILHLK